MKVITLLNEKGGVGKTTLAGMIAAGLALRNKTVLLIDADGQGDLTRNMSLPKQAGFFKFVKWGERGTIDYTPTQDIIQRVPADHCAGNLYIVAGSDDSWAVPTGMTLPRMIRNLNGRLADLRRAFDALVIDTQPSATTLHDAIGFISDYVICPTDCEALSARGGLVSTLDHMAHVRQHAASQGFDKARVIGILPNKYRAQTALHQHFYGELCEDYGELVWNPIPLRTVIPESQFKQVALMHDAPQLDTTQELWSLIDRVEAVLQGVGA